MESSNAALEHRVSHLESIVGEERPVEERPGDGVRERACLLSALRGAAKSTAATVCPEDSERATTTLRRARFLREHGASCDVVSEAAVEEAASQVKSLERAFSDLAVLSPVLDCDWEKERVGLSRVEEDLVKANVVADAAEDAIERESRLLDELLIDYNVAVASMNARFLQLERLVQELEKKHGVSHDAQRAI